MPTPEQLKQLYDNAAQWYDVQHALLTSGTDEACRRWLVLHAVRLGDRILDAGGGTGSTALVAAKQAGPRGHVTCLDLSEPMLDQGRQKAAQQGQSERIRFQQGDLYTLPYADGTFDTVLTTFSLCPLADPSGGVLELYRVLKPGGLLGAAHSAEPAQPLLQQLYHASEAALQRYAPKLTLGCRAVSVLPALQAAGAEVVRQQRLGLPHLPFLAFVVRKPIA